MTATNLGQSGVAGGVPIGNRQASTQSIGVVRRRSFRPRPSSSSLVLEKSKERIEDEDEGRRRGRKRGVRNPESQGRGAAPVMLGVRFISSATLSWGADGLMP